MSISCSIACAIVSLQMDGQFVRYHCGAKMGKVDRRKKEWIDIVSSVPRVVSLALASPGREIGVRNNVHTALGKSSGSWKMSVAQHPM